MLETPHVLIAAAIATKVPNPLLAIPLCLASHFVLDILPHWNPHINRELKKYGKPRKESVRLITVDSFVALFGGIFLATRVHNPSHTILILVCCLISVLPDVVEAPYYFLGKKTTIIEKWITWQKSIQNDIDPLPGLLSQLAIILMSLVWILF